ncbi:MAG: hypothetical protein VX529_06685 [Pseudomonadota bacterium]|nr:hypothetical protein [Pseudomonadota bacterium]
MRILIIAGAALLAGCASMPSEEVLAAKCGSDESCRQTVVFQMQAEERERWRRIGMAMQAVSVPPSQTSTDSRAPTGYLVRNYVDGFNRICVYNSMGSDYVVTIPSAQFCPLSPPR